jgi:hypothetical protein
MNFKDFEKDPNNLKGPIFDAFRDPFASVRNFLIWISFQIFFLFLNMLLIGAILEIAHDVFLAVPTDSGTVAGAAVVARIVTLVFFGKKFPETQKDNNS